MYFIVPCRFGYQFISNFSSIILFSIFFCLPNKLYIIIEISIYIYLLINNYILYKNYFTCYTLYTSPLSRRSPGGHIDGTARAREERLQNHSHQEKR